MYLLLTVILLFINYGILLIAKLLIYPHSYHIFPNGGYRILIAVWLIEIVVVVLVLANRTAEKAILLQRKTALLQQENDTAKYEALQNQLNPHFLFNSLNTLVAEIEYNPKNAVKFTRVLSEVYRYVMQSQQLRTVTLKDEISFLESFIYLHTVRLGDCIIIENHINDSADDIRLAPLSLQLLAENVIKHNVINEDEPMTITLSLDNTGQYLVFENNLRKKLSGSENGIGLKNLSNRYMLLCGKDIIVKSDTKDNKFRVEIPLIYE